MKLLAIDTSCDESCAAIVDSDRWLLLADVVFSHVAKMQKFGGIVPEIASREHLKALPLVVEEALRSTQLTLEQLDGVVVTQTPGLIGALLVGVSYAKGLAYTLGKPLFVVDHIEGHLFSPLLATFETGAAAPQFPWIAAVVSGGHSEIFHVLGAGKMQWLGGTLDDAAGEAFDKVGKLLGLPYPAGPLIDKRVAAAPNREQLRQQFPFPRTRAAGLHLSYSGLKTAVAQKVASLGQRRDGSTDLALMASAQEAILGQLVEKLLTAQAQFPGANLVVTGGVACNSRLRERLPQAYFPAPRHCSDNAAMIALVAALRAKAGELRPASWSVSASPRSALFSA